MMNRALKSVLCLFVSVCVPVIAFSGTSREELSEIRVGRNGHFRYWKSDSPTIKALKSFVADVTDRKSDSFVPVADRVAVFDVDGTLLCETAPTYFNFMAFCYRYLHDDTYSVSDDDRAYAGEIENYIYANRSISSDWGERQMEMQARAFYGMTQEEFSEWVSGFMNSQYVDGLTDLKWGSALYWPMIEVVSYLVANGFRVFICSGCDRDMCRVICKDVFDVPSYMIIGTDVDWVLESRSREGFTTEMTVAEGYRYVPGERIGRGASRQLNTAHNKIASIVRQIGRKPILAWGNSSGDYPMFHYTTMDNSYPSIAFCILCDDTVREFGNEKKAESCRESCGRYGWRPVSMRDEWKTIYGPGVVRADMMPHER